MNMNENSKNTSTMSDPEQYWNRAGEVGYTEAMYSSGLVGNHVKTSMRTHILHAARVLELNENSNILELGCGDGDLANNFLSKHFKTIEAHDLAPAGIERAIQFRQFNTNFFCSDITQLQFDPSKRFDAVFFIGILHHVKSATPSIIEKVSKITDKIVVMEPNGNHLIRKFLETLPSYRRAGEDSFRKTELERIFTNCGYTELYFKRFNLFPNFTPEGIFPLVKGIEPSIENSKSLDFLCTNQIFSFSKASQK